MKASAIAHGVLAAVLLIKSLVFPSKPIPYIPALKVDLVGLPDMLKNERSQHPSESMIKALKQAETEARKVKELKVKPAPKSEPPAEKDEMVLKPKAVGEARNKNMKSALDRIKALNKIKASLNEEESNAKAVQIKGNRISKGTSLDGDAREAAEASYYDVLRERLQENWALPVWVARQNLSAQVQLFIDNRGRLKSYRFLKASGNEQFDAAVKQALTDSSPFPAPPANLADSLTIHGVALGFPL